MGKKPVKNEILLEIEEHHKNLAEEKTDVTLGWFIATNNRKIKRPLQSMRELVAPITDTPEVKAFNEEMGKLYQKHAFRDNKGKPLKQPVPGQPGVFGYPIRDMDEFTADEEKLRAEHSEAVDQLKEYEEKWEALKEETSEIEFYTIHKREIPNQAVPIKTLELWGELGMVIED